MTGANPAGSEDWDRPTLKAAYALWARLHLTYREPRQFGDLDQDTLDDLCIQAAAAVRAFLGETIVHVGFKS